MKTQTRPFAVVTGASTGIGFELAKLAAELQAAIAHIMPAGALAKLHAKQAAPGTASPTKE